MDNTKGKLSIVVGGQFGSEGKGAVAGWLARGDRGLGFVTAAVRVAGPNAGHSAMDANGKVWALRCIPVMAVTNPDCMLVLAAGSEIDPAVLDAEIEMLELGGINVTDRLYIDEQATVLTPEHIEQEGGYGGHLTKAVGSTGKGIGAARADRLWRKARLWGDVYPGHASTDTVTTLREHLSDPYTHVVIEGTQGYGLGLHAGYYPKCTSSDCRAVDFAAMAGITPWTDVNATDVWVTLRTFPIRVAGNSGPLHEELTWEQLADETDGYVRPERTTVTKVERRVGRWDPVLAAEAVKANGGRHAQIALTFFDYWYPELAGCQSTDDLKDHHFDHIERIEREIGASVAYLGTGPGDGIHI